MTDLQRIALSRVFQPVPLPARIDALTRGTLCTGPAEQTFDQGMFVLSLGGTVEVHTSVGQMPLLSAATHLAMGQEMGLFDLYDGLRRVTRLRLGRGGRALLLDRPTMEALVRRHPQLGAVLSLILAQRIRRVTEGLSDALELQALVNPTVGHRLLELQLRKFYGRSRRSPLARLFFAMKRMVTRLADTPLGWMFIGYVSGIWGSRLLVQMHFLHGWAWVLRTSQAGGQGAPIHIHHFNYGMMMMLLASLLAIIPSCRGFLGPISARALFGVGLGVFMDEFGLVLNLHPYYYQLESMIAIVATGLLLVAAALFSDRLSWRR